jgi:hypothetical protein
MKVTARGAAAGAYILTGIISLLGAWFMWQMTPKMDEHFFPYRSCWHYPTFTTLTIEHGKFFAVLLALAGIAIIVGAVCDLKNARANIARVMKAVGILTFSAITGTTFVAWTWPLSVMIEDQNTSSDIEWNLRVREFANQYTFSKAIKISELREIPGNELNPSEVEFGSHVIGTWTSTAIASESGSNELQFRTMHFTADGIVTFVDIEEGEKTLPATEVWSAEYALEAAPAFRIRIKGEWYQCEFSSVVGDEILDQYMRFTGDKLVLEFRKEPPGKL